MPLGSADQQELKSLTGMPSPSDGSELAGTAPLIPDIG